LKLVCVLNFFEFEEVSFLEYNVEVGDGPIKVE